MAYTISTHNGSAVSRQHNLRNPKVVSKQLHIRRDGVHETWLDKNPRELYRELFGDALEDYNKKQLEAGRPERMMKSYYAAVKNDAKKHPVYEMIVSVGCVKNRPSESVSKEILREFFDKWEERNPSLKLAGAYYHYDEEGVPHVHIDYVPVAHGYKNGLEVQNGLVRALNEIGFETVHSKDTAQMQWEKRENQYLEELCNKRGLEVEHPKGEKRKHRDTEQYKADEKLKETQEKVNKQQGKLERLQNDYDYLLVRAQNFRKEGDKRFAEYKNTLEAQKSQIEALNAYIETLKEEVKHQKVIYEIFGGNPATLPTSAPPVRQETEYEQIDFDSLR